MRLPLLLSALLVPLSGWAADYLVVISEKTVADPAWEKVATTLVEKHEGAVVIRYGDKLEEALPSLKEHHPRHTCFVATPDETSLAFVAEVHQLCRRLDEDPWADTRWGILTGFDAANALAIASQSEPLTVRKVASGTELAMECVKEGLWYCELKKNLMVGKKAGAEAVEARGPDDTTRALADTLTDYQADLFVTSGHATERDWQIGYSYPNGSFRSKNGQLLGVPRGGKPFDINSSNPKVYLPIGNCLMGHIDGPDAMALAWLNSAGVVQMTGYTVPTWFGYAGWGLLDYFIEQPGRYTYNEAFFANHQALLHRLENEFPDLARKEVPVGKVTAHNVGGGLRFDRDVVAFYGDPAWSARLAHGPLRWTQTLEEKDGQFTFLITPTAAAESYATVNKNGAQRGGRPVVEFLPRRMPGKIEILEGKELGALVADDFILLPHANLDPSQPQKLVFRFR